MFNSQMSLFTTYFTCTEARINITERKAFVAFFNGLVHGKTMLVWK